MLRSLNGILNYTIEATDGALGALKDIYFDDWEWMVRYLVLDTGKWLPGRKVLVSPVSIAVLNWNQNTISVDLTTEQIKNSPGIEEDKPVSRQLEEELVRHYRWPIYWGGPSPMHGINPEPERAEGQPGGDSHLRSVNRVCGYHIHATDGSIGHVEDFVATDDDWTIRYMVVDTRNWLPGRKVLVAPWMVRNIDWAESAVYVELTRNQIKESPEFDPAQPVNREYEEQLYDYYGRPRYWV